MRFALQTVTCAAACAAICAATCAATRAAMCAATVAATCAATRATMLSVLQLKEPGYRRPPAMRNPWSLKGQLFRLATKFWMWGFTPGILIRGLGPVGKRWSEGYARARYAGPNKLKLVKHLQYQLRAGLRNMCRGEQARLCEANAELAKLKSCLCACGVSQSSTFSAAVIHE